MTDVLVAIAAGGIRPITFHVLLIALIVAVVRFGNSLSRTASIGWMVACLLSDIAGAHNRYGFRQIEPALLSIDVATLIFFIWLSLREPRFWLVGAAAFQLIAVSAHFVMGGGPGIGRWVYQIFVYGAGWGTLLALIWGQDAIAVAQRDAADGYLQT